MKQFSTSNMNSKISKFQNLKFAFIIILANCFFTLSLQAQSPQAIPYQAVARDAMGNVLANQNISLRLTLIDSNISLIDYQETQSVTTNALGLFTIHIGEGTPIFGTLGNIAWSISGNEHLQVEMDIAGGTNYTNMGTTKFLSVPFALHANSSGDNQWNQFGANISNKNSGNVGIGVMAPSGKLEIAADAAKDELVVGENVFPSNDAANRIQLGNSVNSSFMRIGQSATNFLSVGWLYNPDGNLGFGQVSTFDSINPLILQRFGGNVGIGTLTPSAKLDVNGMGFFRNNPGGFVTGAGAGIKISTENNQGNIFGYDYSSFTPIDLILQGEGAKVGIGNHYPESTLHITKPNDATTITIGGNSQTGQFTALRLQTSANQGGYSNIQSIKYSGFDYGDLILNRDGGNVGIGTSTPLAKLEVAGNIKIADGTEGLGKVLTSDANGVASWITPSGGGVWSQNGNDISNTNSGKVGIGTTTPAALLDVKGDVLMNGLIIGRGVGNDSTNAVLGFEALANNAGAGNTAMGYQTLKQNTTGFWNTAIGGAALTANTTGKYNIGIGVNSLGTNTSGDYNTAVGTQSMNANETGEQNTAFGFNSLTYNTTGNYNTALGLQTLFFNTTGQQNTAVGLSSMQANTEGIRNTALGMNTLFANTTGNNNTAIGRSALIANTTGSANTSVGERTLILNQTGSHNTAVGDSAALNYLANDITAVGYQALANTSTGEQNVAVGSQSLGANTFGAGNTAVGYQALSGNETGTNNTAMGNKANVLFSSLTNATAIGANAQAAQNNSIVLGSINGANGASSSVNVGIGNNTPQHTLSIGDATADFQNVMLRGYSNSPLNWKGGAAFGYTTASVIMGELNGVASIGGHDGTLSGWSNLIINEGGGNVGIGTASPGAKLDVAGSTKTNSIQITNGASNGAVLTSDANGNASWVSPVTNTPVGCVLRVRNWTAAASGTSYGAGTYLAPSLIDSFGVFGDTRLVNSGSMNVLLGSAANTLVFTAPSSGYYQVSFKVISVASSVRLLISASLNGTTPVEIVDQLTSNPCANCSEVNYTQVIYMNAGDTHRILRSSGGTAINDMVLSYRKL
ncbi:MAG: hypothetical protein IPI46_00695 [Bacteroidetes bacterium]|nr:hypothetical protein [Bacteroidota bacterium]